MFDLQGRPQGSLPLPPVAGNDEIDPLADGDVLYDVSTCRVRMISPASLCDTVAYS